MGGFGMPPGMGMGGPGMGIGGGLGMGMGTNQQPTSFNNVFGTNIAPTVNQSVLDSFKKDGFNFGGYKAPEKK